MKGNIYGLRYEIKRIMQNYERYGVSLIAVSYTQNKEQKDAINNYEYIEKKYFSDLLTTFFKEKRRK